MESQAQDAPSVLGELIAAGLVSHEMIGDPGRLGGETAALHALCGLVAGPVYRIDAYHYAFRAGPGDLGGRLGELAPGDWTRALEAALAEALGPEAVWLNPTDLMAEDAALSPPLMLLRAQGAAAQGALEAAGPGVLAVVNARYAAEVARLTAAEAGAGAAPGMARDDRLAAIEARQAAILERLEARESARDGEAAALGRLAETLAVALQRLDAQAEVLHTHIVREDRVAGRLTEIAALAGGAGDFEERLGLTLAEFLARLEARGEDAPRRVPQFS